MENSTGRNSGGRGRGRQSGGGRGRGGRGGGRGPGRGGGGGASSNNKQDRRANKRQLQLQAMAKKAADEDAYFRQCQKEARNASRSSAPKDDTTKEREDELFGKQMVKGINFNKYNEIKVEVKAPDMANQETPVMEDFSKLPNLTPQLQTNIQLMKYTHPTPIQKNALPLAMAGQDLMCCAQTGSGKTCAFLLPVVAALVGTNQNKNNPTPVNNNGKPGLEPAKPKCIVLAPTRELASQIELEAQKLTHAIPSVQPVVVYGGANPKAQLKELAYASTSSSENNLKNLLVVATPGRLTDFVDRNLVSLSEVQYLILDEADRCLDMGFEPQIRKIVQQSGMTPKEKRQTFLFSATFPPAIQKLAAEFLRPNYVWIAIGRVGSTTDSITQVLVKATPDKRHKLELLVQALQNGPKGRTLIFVQKKRTATWLKKQLNKGGPDAGPKANKRGGEGQDNTKHQQQPFQGKEIKFTPIAAEEIHGDRSQSQREAALEKFRSGKCMVLVATDVAARGLDIPGVEHVINMDLPTAADDFDSYVHRIGRTGRAGNEGLATSLFVPGDNPKVENGRIASLLLNQLKESKQEVPPWFESLVAGGGGGGNSNNRNRPQFTSTDVRKNSSRPANSTRNNNAPTGNTSDKTSGNDDNPNLRGSAGRGRGRGRGGRGRGREGRGQESATTDGNQTTPDGGTSESAAGRSGGRGGNRGRGRGRGRGRNQSRGRGEKQAGRDSE